MDAVKAVAFPESTAILLIQPLPTILQVYHSHHNGRVDTSIARTWDIADARRCSLCRQCTATKSADGDQAMCLKVHEGFVSLDEAALFRDLTQADFRPIHEFTETSA